jgi:hypothetical protein
MVWSSAEKPSHLVAVPKACKTQSGNAPNKTRLSAGKSVLVEGILVGQASRMLSDIRSTVIYTFYTVILKAEPFMRFRADCLGDCRNSTTRRARIELVWWPAVRPSMYLSALIEKFCNLFQFVVKN